MMADLETFIFQELSFKKLDNSPLVVDNEKPGNAGTSSGSQQGSNKKDSTQQQGNNQQKDLIQRFTGSQVQNQTQTQVSNQ